MSTLATNAITDASGGNTATINGYTPTESNMAGRNRLINSDMRIDQRNAGASVSVPNSTFAYPVDRFHSNNNSSTASYTLQRVTDAPVGFVNSVKMTVTATDSLSSATQYCRIRQAVEANNVDDLGWGGANAKAITVSFWVKSSVTGTFSMSILNSAYNYSYPVSYTISAADTWEYKTITIPGPTAGTWATGTDAGLNIQWTWGANSNILGTSGSWSANRYEGVTGQVNLMATNGATWQITGVQLEAGSVATPFERRSYGQELALCQRYYEFGQNSSSGGYIGAAGVSLYSMTCYKATKRSTVTFTTTNCQSQASGGAVTNRTFGTSANDTQGFSPMLAGSDPVCYVTWQASAEL